MPAIRFEIVRRINAAGAYGMLLHPDVNGIFVPVCGTLERSYLYNERLYAKIPDGVHYCSRSHYFKGKYDTYEIHIPDHDRILFHKGNWPTDSEGCVLLGEQYTDFDAADGIQTSVLGNSGAAFTEFMKLANGEHGFFLKVTTA